MRSMVEGASESELRFLHRRIVEARAPSTALRAVPSPVFTGEDESLHRRQIERLIDQRAGAFEVENTIERLLRHK